MREEDSGYNPPPPESDRSRLAKHLEPFAEPRVIQVSESMFVAFAYSMCNVAWLTSPCF